MEDGGLACGHLGEEVTRPQLALEDGRDGGMQHALELAVDDRRQPQPEDADERRALKVTKDLERIGRDGAGPVGGMSAYMARLVSGGG